MKHFLKVLGISLIITLIVISLPFAIMAVSAVLTFGVVILCVYVALNLFGPDTSEEVKHDEEAGFEPRRRNPNHYDPSKNNDTRPH